MKVFNKSVEINSKYTKRQYIYLEYRLCYNKLNYSH